MSSHPALGVTTHLDATVGHHNYIQDILPLLYKKSAHCCLAGAAGSRSSRQEGGKSYRSAGGDLYRRIVQKESGGTGRVRRCRKGPILYPVSRAPVTLGQHCTRSQYHNTRPTPARAEIKPIRTHFIHHFRWLFLWKKKISANIVR